MTQHCMDKTSGMKEALRHFFNPLHVYCRLKERGMEAERAKRICSMYQKVYTRIL